MERTRAIEAGLWWGLLVLLVGSVGGLGACSAVVKFKDPPSRCGDGIKDDWESCDGSDLGDSSCEQLGYPRGVLTCNNECELMTDQCIGVACGNGLREDEEECDSPDLAMETCQGLGFAQGQLACTGDCTYDTSQCSYAVCGDGYCDLNDGEDNDTCAEDCDAHCGNSICEVGRGETTASCETDCAWQQVSAGAGFTCATRKDNSIWCWGANELGQLGNNGDVDSRWPVRVEGIDSVQQLSAGRDHVCAIRNDGLWCWGEGLWGQLGTGDFNDQNEPVYIGHSGAGSIAAGGDASCGIVNETDLYCWGANGAWQLGRGEVSTLPMCQGSVPCSADLLVVENLGGMNRSAVSVARAGDGDTHACALVGGVAYCWGRSAESQNGRSDATALALPMPVDGWSASIPELAYITTGHGFTCAADSSIVYCWGANDTGQLGNGSGDSTPTSIPQMVAGALGQISSLSAGYGHTCVSNTIGQAWCWGANSSGQLGNGSLDDNNAPLMPSSLPGHVETISAGDTHTCALVTIDSPSQYLALYCWGENNRGQLGDGTVNGANYPVEVIDIPPPSSR